MFLLFYNNLITTFKLKVFLDIFLLFLSYKTIRINNKQYSPNIFF
jgi:hypothetical protein